MKTITVLLAILVLMGAVALGYFIVVPMIQEKQAAQEMQVVYHLYCYDRNGNTLYDGPNVEHLCEGNGVCEIKQYGSWDEFYGYCRQTPPL